MAIMEAGVATGPLSPFFKIMNIDSKQLAIVEDQSTHRLVAANPGSGKTRTLVATIHHAIDTGTRPSEIVCMTFTNAGAYELAKRLGNIRLGYLGTLHGYCFRLLQRFGTEIGFRAGGINLIGEEASAEMLKAIATKMKYRGSDKALKEARDPSAQLIHKNHAFELKRNNLVDYDGVLREAIELLRKLAIAGRLPKIALLLVDEAQDSALADWEIYDLLCALRRFIVGDPDQSIFGFRGAYPVGFLEAWHSMENATGFLLEKNYRSGRAICAAAESLIQHNEKRVHKRIIDNGTNGHIGLTTYGNDVTERQGVAESIRSMMAANLIPPSDIAVLCRTNRIANQFRDELQMRGIPVRGHVEQKLPADFGFALDILSMISDPRSDFLTERVLNRICKPKELAIAKKRAVDFSLPLFAVAEDMCIIPVFDTVNTKNVAELLAAYGVSHETRDLIQQRIDQLPQEDPALTDLRHDLFNAKDWTRPEGDESGVTVTTIHASKGREWPVVYLPAWEQGILPSTREDSDIEENRRLAFVAITRAAEYCHISYAQERAQEWGPTKSNLPSRFIREVGLL